MNTDTQEQRPVYDEKEEYYDLLMEQQEQQ